ncbi:MAG: AIR synthase family protein [Planctomycetes bacterium]|nr:AIR synthase family protein [Planctomycetota bacterium]
MDKNSAFPEIGKITPEFFSHYIYPRLGAKRDDVLVGPKNGVDIGVVNIGNGRVMAVTTDPIFILPLFGFEKSAWFAWHILASDITTSGFPPAHISADWNLPMSITEEQFEVISRVWHEESEKYGAAIVAGHTARYTGSDYPMIGGATFTAVGDEDKYITPAMAQEGDAVLMTKGAAIEAVGIFATLFPKTIVKKHGSRILEQGQACFDQMSTVEDALTAVSVGVRENGVTTMHDATEGGVIGGLFEIASASNLGIEINIDEIYVPDGVGEVCELFGMEVLHAISEGTLLLTVKQHKKAEVNQALAQKGINVYEIGTILPKNEGRWSIKSGQRSELVHPRVDPYWSAIDRAFAAKLD